MKRLERLVNMALVLATRRRLRAADLADQFSISERTVYRDVRALQSAGFPVEGTSGDGYCVSPSAYLRPLALDESEASALAMAAQLLGASADEPLRRHLVSATAKLESVLSAEGRARIRRQRAGVYVSTSGRRPAGPLGKIMDAVDAWHVLKIRYEPVSKRPPTEREVEPLGLVRIEQAWLLVAYCRLRSDVRVFRVDRILDTRATGERFTPRPDVSFSQVIERERRRFPAS
jgi:predicted DNA-binding transcriptional regulator YafY